MTSPATDPTTTHTATPVARKLLLSAKQGYISVFGDDSFYKTKMATTIQMDKWRGKDLLLVHTMGKVGSTTISASLKANGLERSKAIYQPHFLTKEGMDFVENLTIDGMGGLENLSERTRHFFILSHLLGDELQRLRKQGKQVKIISMVRDPVATNLSGLFHNHEWWPANIKANCHDLSIGCLDQLLEHFLANYPHQVPDTWFDMEMRPLYDVDVFAEPFDQERGYQLYSSDVADVLLLKLEKLRQSGSMALREFLGQDDFILTDSNKAEDKSYAHLYKAFRENEALPESYLDDLYGTRFSHHFYSTEEIQTFRHKWLSPQKAR